MQQNSPNEPLMTTGSGVSGWLPVWIKAVSKPNEQTFAEITDRPGVSSSTAFLWVFLATTLSSILSGILTAIMQAVGFTSPTYLEGLEEYFGTTPVDTSTIVGSLVGTVCFSPVVGVISVVFFAIGIAIIQWIAKLFGGLGSFDKLAYAFAAISVPISLVATILSPLGVIPWLGVCTSLLSIGVAIYALVLQVMAVKGVNRFGWGAAIGSILVPWLVFVLFCACLVGIVFALLASTLGDTFTIREIFETITEPFRNLTQ
jgi:hypothetical protein